MKTKKVKVNITYPIVQFSSAEYITEIDEDIDIDRLDDEDKADFILEQFEKGNLTEKPMWKRDLLNCLEVDYCKVKLTDI